MSLEKLRRNYALHVLIALVIFGLVSYPHVSRHNPTEVAFSEGILVDPKRINTVCKKYNIIREPTLYTFHVDENMKLATCFHYKVVEFPTPFVESELMDPDKGGVHHPVHAFLPHGRRRCW